MKIKVTVEIDVDTEDVGMAQKITSEMDYSFSWKNGHNEELITSTEILEVEV